jgi:hypothetical protein
MIRLVHFPSFIAPIVLSLTLTACSDSDSNIDREAPSESMVAINQVQYLGTHNSYHMRIRDDIFQILLSFIPELAPTLDYSQVPLTEQFESQGVRHIELDVFRDPEGGLYADRHALVLFEEDIASGIPQLSEPGLKVLHVQEIDYQTSCYTFVACLKEVKAWSDSNPDHLPIMVLVEAKDEVIDDPLDLSFSIPLPIDESALDNIDSEILSVFPGAQLITPDFVRGERGSLEEAVLEDGWPLLQEARGRIMFALDNGGATRDMYTDGHPSLEGRVMFTNSAPGTPEAAFIKQNDPSDFMAIQQLVQQGYMVRTRADADTEQARTGDTTRREAALESGAHFISTDYPVPDLRFSDYQVQIPGDNIARCNPVNAGTDCDDSNL